MRREVVSPVVFAGLCAGLGCVVAYVLLHKIAPELMMRALVTTAIGSFGACWVLWRQASEWVQLNGALAGALIGFCAAPLAKLASLLLWLTCSWLGHVTGMVPDPGFDLIAGVGGAFKTSAVAIVVAGPITIPAGVLFGWLCARPFEKSPV